MQNFHMHNNLGRVRFVQRTRFQIQYLPSLSTQAEKSPLRGRQRHSAGFTAQEDRRDAEISLNIHVYESLDIVGNAIVKVLFEASWSDL